MTFEIVQYIYHSSSMQLQNKRNRYRISGFVNPEFNEPEPWREFFFLHE